LNEASEHEEPPESGELERLLAEWLDPTETYMALVRVPFLNDAAASRRQNFISGRQLGTFFERHGLTGREVEIGWATSPEHPALASLLYTAMGAQAAPWDIEADKEPDLSTQHDVFSPVSLANGEASVHFEYRVIRCVRRLLAGLTPATAASGKRLRVLVVIAFGDVVSAILRSATLATGVFEGSRWSIEESIPPGTVSIVHQPPLDAS